MKLVLLQEPLMVHRFNEHGNLIEHRALECYAFGNWKIGSYFNKIRLPKNSKQGYKNVRIWVLVDSDGKTVFSAEKMYWVLNFAKIVEYAKKSVSDIDTFVSKITSSNRFKDILESMGTFGNIDSNHQMIDLLLIRK